MTRPTTRRLRARRRGAGSRSGGPCVTPGRLLDVPAARLGVARREVGLGVARSGANRPGADVHRDLVLLLLEPVGAGDAAAAASLSTDPQLGDQRHQVERRLADAVALLLARRVVGAPSSRSGAKSVRSSPRSCSVEQVLADVERCARRPRGRSASSSSPRISRASRLSISVQLVEVPTMSMPAARVRARACCASRRT